jgi:hypothetical protein
MGQTHQFQCRACSYSVFVSGGPDVGMTFATQTIACAKCKELRDVVISEKPWEVMRNEGRRLPLRCPRKRTAKHPVKAWSAGGPCPKCGGTMKRGALEGPLWD